jgi:hypothetical protein
MIPAGSPAAAFGEVRQADERHAVPHGVAAPAELSRRARAPDPAPAGRPTKEGVMTAVEERVARGADWLDAVYPEWWTKIDLGRLDLGNSCRCVLGQLFGTEDARGFDAGFWVATEMARIAGLNGEWAAGHGFQTTFVDDNGVHTGYAALDEAWIVEIKRRWEHGEAFALDPEPPPGLGSNTAGGSGSNGTANATVHEGTARRSRGAEPSAAAVPQT